MIAHPYNLAVFYRHFITRAQIHICETLLALVLSASRYLVFFFVVIRTRWGFSIRRSSHRDLLGFSAVIRRRFEKKQTVKGESTFAMYRLGIMVGAFRAPLSTTRRLLCVTPVLKSGTLLHSTLFHPSAPLLRPGGEFVSLTQTEAHPLDHFNAFLCFRFA